MKILTLSVLSLATVSVCVVAGAQNPATPPASTAQADKQFLQQLERTEPVGQNPVQSADVPVETTASQPPAAPAETKQPKPAPAVRKTATARRSSVPEPARTVDKSATVTATQERPQTEIRPVEKKSKREPETRVTAGSVENVEPVAESYDQFVPTHPVRKVNPERTTKTTTLDPFYDGATRTPISGGTRYSKAPASAAQPLPEVATGSPRTVTVTKTTVIIPQPAPKSDQDGFFSRLFHHKDHRDE